MRTRVLPGALAIVCTLAFAVPAGAINIGGTDYTLVGKTNVTMKNGSLLSIQGNVGVNDVGGLLRIGASNKIIGGAFADRIFFGSGATVDNCAFNSSSGAHPTAACVEISSTIVPITAWPPVPVPVVPVGVRDPICPTDGALDLAPGNYRNLLVKAGCVLTLSAGTYNFKKIHLTRTFTSSVTEVRVTQVRGSGSSATTIDVASKVLTGGSVTINDVSITSIAVGTYDAIKIGRDSVLNNVRLHAPNARLHLQKGGVYSNFEGMAKFITVEQISISGMPPN